MLFHGLLSLCALCALCSLAGAFAPPYQYKDLYVTSPVTKHTIDIRAVAHMLNVDLVKINPRLNDDQRNYLINKDYVERLMTLSTSAHDWNEASPAKQELKFVLPKKMVDGDRPTWYMVYWVESAAAAMNFEFEAYKLADALLLAHLAAQVYGLENTRTQIAALYIYLKMMLYENNGALGATGSFTRQTFYKFLLDVEVAVHRNYQQGELKIFDPFQIAGCDVACAVAERFNNNGTSYEFPGATTCSPDVILTKLANSVVVSQGQEEDRLIAAYASRLVAFSFPGTYSPLVLYFEQKTRPQSQQSTQVLPLSNPQRVNQILASSNPYVSHVMEKVKHLLLGGALIILIVCIFVKMSAKRKALAMEQQQVEMGGTAHGNHRAYVRW